MSIMLLLLFLLRFKATGFWRIPLEINWVGIWGFIRTCWAFASRIINAQSGRGKGKCHVCLLHICIKMLLVLSLYSFPVSRGEWVTFIVRGECMLLILNIICRSSSFAFRRYGSGVVLIVECEETKVLKLLVWCLLREKVSDSQLKCTALLEPYFVHLFVTLICRVVLATVHRRH